MVDFNSLTYPILPFKEMSETIFVDVYGRLVFISSMNGKITLEAIITGIADRYGTWYSSNN